MYPHQSSNGEERVDWRGQQQRDHSFHNSTGQFDMAAEQDAAFQTEPAGDPMEAFHQSIGGTRRGDLEYNNDVDDGLFMEDDEPPQNRYNNDGSCTNHTSPPSSSPTRRGRMAADSRTRMSVPNLVASMSMAQPANNRSHMGGSNSLDGDSHHSHSESHQQSQQSQNSADFVSAPYQDLLSEQQALEEQHQAIQRATSRRPPKRTPLPKAGLPMEPIIPVVEPTLPAAKLSKRGMPKRKVRLPDLQVGVAPKPQANNGGQVLLVYVVDCAGCGSQLQIEKGTILVQCYACQQVHPTATCRVQHT
jgi:hypothetical protein